MSDNHKAIPRHVLIFGAAGHIGGPLADFLSRVAPDIRLRLVSRDAARAKQLQSRLPCAEVVQADYSDPASLARAVADIEGIFVLTPSGTDERQAMGNLVGAIRSAGTYPHIIRLVGYHPEYNPHRIGDWLTRHGMGLPIQHPLAKCWMELEAAWLMVLRAGWQYDQNLPCGPAANAAKYLAAEAGFHACEQAVMTHGGFGYAKEYHVERYLRESLIPRIAPISPQLILSFIAEKVLGLPKSY